MKTIKPVTYPKSWEKKFERLMESMTVSMAKQFENETLKKLNKGTINKFTDDQVGNYANIFLGLSKAAKRKIMKRWSDDRLEAEVKRMLTSLNRRNQKQFYDNHERVTGIPVKQMIAQEGLTFQNNALIAETQEWIKSLRDQNLQHFSNNALRVMAGGADFEEVVNQYGEEVEKRRNHAKFVSRQQLSTFNSLSNKLRAQKLGITKATWQTAQDERVRTSHIDRQGKEFDLSEGLYSSVDGKTLLPGIDYGCRCIARYVLPNNEE